MVTEFENYKILLVDDDPDSIEFIRYNLKKEGFKVYSVNNGIEAVKKARETIPHIILLDIMMPEMDGVETCEEIRKISSLNKTIIAFLTARGEDYSQIAGFDAGGDDYITKPIKPKVLLSRIRALLKRYHSTDEAIVSSAKIVESKAGFVIDKDRYLVVKDGKDIALPKKEFELLNILISRPEKVFTREEIFHSVWGDKIIVGDRTIDVHIRKLREKIGEEYIKTIKGVGYKFVG